MEDAENRDAIVHSLVDGIDLPCAPACVRCPTMKSRLFEHAAILSAIDQFIFFFLVGKRVPANAPPVDVLTVGNSLGARDDGWPHQ